VSKKIVFSIAMSLLILAGCVAVPQVQKSSLELQAIQVKEFETDSKTAFTSVMSVFQDLGYTINTASLETGLITAKSPTVQELVPFVGQKMSDEKATAFVEQISKNRTKIRLSFVQSSQTSSGYGMRGERETPVQEPQPYVNAFSKIQQSIFLKTNTN
jgi:PBP1b-binding outer membrane lipoprotein LpoB